MQSTQPAYPPQSAEPTQPAAPIDTSEAGRLAGDVVNAANAPQTNTMPDGMSPIPPEEVIPPNLGGDVRVPVLTGAATADSFTQPAAPAMPQIRINATPITPVTPGAQNIVPSSPPLVEITQAQPPAPALAQQPTPDWEAMGADKTPITYGPMAPEALDAAIANPESPEEQASVEVMKALEESPEAMLAAAAALAQKDPSLLKRIIPLVRKSLDNIELR